MNVYSIKSGHLELKDVDNAKGIVSGYFSAFGNKDADGDIILKGAFSRSINNNGPKSLSPRIKHLLNHNPSQPVGKLVDLMEDEKGLLYTSQIGSHTLGRDFIKMAESGLITEHSIGFQIIKEQKNSAGENEISEMKLWEGSSLTAWGANHLTPLTDMKGVYDIEDVNKRIESLEIFCKNTDASDDTIQALLLQIKQLQQLLIMSSTPPALKAQDTQKDENEQEEKIKLLIIKNYS